MIRLTPALVLFLPVSVRAATEAGTHSPSWGLLVAAIFNLLVLVVILLRFTRRPIRDFLIQRRRAIARAIEEAEARVAKAEAELERWSARSASVEAEAAELVQLAQEQAEAQGARRLARAEETASRIQHDAGALAEHEVERAGQMLRAEAAQLATSLAEVLLREHIRPEDDRRLFAEYAERIGGAV